ncbi:MAG: hypothetical protein ACRCZI_04390, partial [Cetobacterium sp.]
MERIAQIPSTAAWATKCVVTQGDGAEIANAIQARKAIAVSDGGLKFGLGTAAFIIEGHGAQGRIKGVNKVPGPIKEGDSHRCEAAGLYAIILLTKEICDLHQIQDGGITIYCDNTMALDIFAPDYLPDPKRPNFDLESACWALKNKTNITWKAEHVKGHQDRAKSIHTLTRQAKLNIEVDRTATAYWIHLVSRSKVMPTPEIIPIHGEEWQLWQGEKKITHPSRKLLYAIMQDRSTQMWWLREQHIKPATKKLVDYEAVQDAMQHLSLPRRRYVTKVASENCGVGTTLVEWKYQISAKCPRCSHEHETTQHVQQCRGYAAHHSFTQSMEKLEKYLTNEITSPDVQEAVTHCLKRWQSQKAIQLYKFPREVKEVILQQHKIGWLDFLECLPAKGWQMLQRRYYREEGLQKSSKRWLRGLLLQLHHLGHKQWRHRCEVKNNITKPTEQELLNTIHIEIKQQFEWGPAQLQ